MEDQTTVITKPAGANSTREEPTSPSHLFQISVRAWLAIMLISIVCIFGLATVALAIMLKQPDLLKVSEPLYTMSGMALAYYFGQQKPQQNKIQS